MTASPEVRQLAEKLHSKGICQTMASAFQMAESMLVTSSKVTKDFNSRFEKKEPIHPSPNPSLRGMPNSVTSLLEEPQDPLADPKDDDKDEDEDAHHEEERVSTILKPVTMPKVEKPKPLFHAPTTSGMTLHELMDSGNGELKYDGSKVHYNEQKMPQAQAVLSPEPVQPISQPQPIQTLPPQAPIEMPKPVEAPQAATVELPKVPVQASPAELEKKNALYTKVDLSAVFGG